MSDVAILLVKGLAGGALVVVFACLAQGLRPKRFAGLFSAAPAVAIAGLSITVLDKGAHAARESAMGMLAGSAGMTAYALSARWLLGRHKARRSAVTALGAWILVAALAAIPVLAA